MSKEVIAVIRLQPGQGGFYDELSRIHLTIGNPQANVYAGTNCSQLRRSVRAGRLRLVSGSFGPEVQPFKLVRDGNRFVLANNADKKAEAFAEPVAKAEVETVATESVAEAEANTVEENIVPVDEITETEESVEASDTAKVETEVTEAAEEAVVEEKATTKKASRRGKRAVKKTADAE